MPPKRDLSQDQIQEIRSLRGRLSAAEAKERFGIGTTRLYRIWRGGDDPTKARPLPSQIEASPSPLQTETSPLPLQTETNPRQATPPEQLPTVVDFYNRLGRLEIHVEQASARVEQATDLLARVAERQFQRGYDDSDSSAASDILENLEEVREEQEETRMDMQRVGEIVEAGQKWAWISIAAVLVWKDVSKTWNRSAPVGQGVPLQQEDVPSQSKTRPTEGVPRLPKNTRPGDPHYMA